MTYVLDASAYLRFLVNEPGAIEVERILKLAKDGTAQILMSAVNWGEVLHSILKRNGEAVMNQVESNLLSLPIQILPEDAVTVKEAAMFQFTYKVPYTDSFAGSLAIRSRATLITADYDFHPIGAPLMAHFLPTKGKSKTP